MENELTHTDLIAIARKALEDAKAEGHNERLAETLRAAAWYARGEAEEMTVSAFGDAAASLGYHRQGATNRWREAMKNWEVAFG